MLPFVLWTDMVKTVLLPLLLWRAGKACDAEAAREAKMRALRDGFIVERMIDLIYAVGFGDVVED